MRTADAKETYERLVASRGLTAANRDPPSAVGSLLDFFVSTRADDAEFDAVYLTWGTYDSGHGEERSFQYSIWRQFFVAGTPSEDADDGIWELEFCYHYRPEAETTRLGRGGEICAGPGDAQEFRNLVEGLPASACASRSTPDRVEFRFGQGG